MKSAIKIASPEPPFTELEGFAEIAHLIASSRERVIQSVNTGIIDLYWKIGERISRKIAAAEWGDGVVEQLATYPVEASPECGALPGATYLE